RRADRSSARAGAVVRATLRRVRPRVADACVRRPLWLAVTRRAAAHRRNRPSYGTRRAAHNSAADVHARVAGARLVRHRAWRCCGVRRDSCPSHAAVRPDAVRSLDVRRGRHHSGRHRARRVGHPGSARQPDRSNRGAEREFMKTRFWPGLILLLSFAVAWSITVRAMQSTADSTAASFLGTWTGTWEGMGASGGLEVTLEKGADALGGRVAA